MTKNDLLELISDYYGGDELVLMSPGGRKMAVTGVDLNATSETGELTLSTAWLTKEKEPEAEPEVQKPSKKKKEPAKPKRGRPKGSTNKKTTRR